MTGKGIYQNAIVLLYVLLITPFAIVLFLHGFFPVIHYDNSIATNNNIPKFVDNVRVKTNSLYEPIVQRVVIMMIDALRWDFITGPIGKASMPVTSSLIANSTACLLQVKVQAPTVTMPRIKAITTGTIPSFIDVALNFGNHQIESDSVLLQAKKEGHKLIFYGDDTWLKLFPTLFDRYDGTTSFFVTDFTEVDTNVTRHLRNELQNTDWSVMILHYLGLDHIGHVLGPFAPLIKTKLKEMDVIIAQIQSKIQYWNRNKIRSMLIICGDHGMKDSGGHGGSTIQETTVPFILIGSPCSKKDNEITQIAQSDIATTLAVMLGIPIPFSNLGSVSLNVLDHLPSSKKLFILYYNSQQIMNHFQKIPNYKSQIAYQKYLDAIKLHVAWLTTSNQSNDVVNSIITAYDNALKAMQEILIMNTIKYDTYLMTTAMSFLCHFLWIVTATQYLPIISFKTATLLFGINIIVLEIVCYSWDPGSGVIHKFSNITDTLLSLIIIGILFINGTFLMRVQHSQLFSYELPDSKAIQQLLLFGTFAHAISFSGSSFIEEEHQTWYFLWITFLTMLLYNNITKLFADWQMNQIQFSHVSICIQLLLLMIGHRILRKLNSTGDKYAHLPDISGWLKEQESNMAMTILLIVALALLIWIGFLYEDPQYKVVSLMLNTAVTVCIYLRHMINNTVIQIPFYPLSRGIYEVYTFWILMIVSLMYYIFRLTLTVQYNKKDLQTQMIFFLIQMWVMISAMLHQPYNVILLPTQILCNIVISMAFKNYQGAKLITFMYIWSGNVFYFYQGNSNSLATIDVAAGYVGLQSYIFFITGTYLLINTYSAPVLAYLMLVHHTILKHPHRTFQTLILVSRIYTTWRLLPMLIYTIVISIQRYHLFIWTVFSPKLLYEAVHSAVMCFVIFVTVLLIILQSIIIMYNNKHTI